VATKIPSKHVVIPEWLYNELDRIAEPMQSRTGVIVAMYNEFVKRHNFDKEIIRDESGKIIGYKPIIINKGGTK
jgi:metal-responsive CopG/Arc/MetJ family transcriptional regulator